MFIPIIEERRFGLKNVRMLLNEFSRAFRITLCIVNEYKADAKDMNEAVVIGETKINVATTRDEVG